MGFLAPIMLLAAGAVIVPLVLHLFQRRDSRRVPFPAIRYLQRAERDHARSIRFRQLLLLALRILVVLLLAAAGARLYLTVGDSSHEPTALVLILDNSLSSGLVEDQRRVLDRLRDRALESLEAASPEDRIWVLRAGEPWDPVRPLTAGQAREKVRRTEPSHASGRLTEVLARAGALVRGAGLPAEEIHLLSDLQASAFDSVGATLPADVPVVTLVGSADPPANRWIGRVEVAGGAPPMAGEATEIVVAVEALSSGSDSLSIRLLRDERVRGAALAPPGTRAVIPVGPFDRDMLVSGRVEIDPDALRADDRRHFAFRVRPPSRVRVTGGTGASADAPDFLGRALEVLEEGGRIERVQTLREAEVLLSRGGPGLEDLSPGTPAVVIPPSDPTLLPALNRRLAQAGIPAEVGPAPGEGTGETRILPGSPVSGLDGLRVRRHYRLTLDASGSGGGSPASLATGDPWLVAGRGARGPFLLVASPLDSRATDLPVSAAMIPFLEWALSTWPAGESGASGLQVGDSLPGIEAATAVEAPDGTLHTLAGTAAPPKLRIPGVYRILRGDTVTDVVAVNPPTSESDLTRVREARLRELVGPGLVTVSDPSTWAREIFVRRKGPELWRPLLVAALLALLAESLVAAGGRTSGARSEENAPDPE